jgi:hypothetical protein
MKMQLKGNPIRVNATVETTLWQEAIVAIALNPFKQQIKQFKSTRFLDSPMNPYKVPPVTKKRLFFKQICAELVGRDKYSGYSF